MEYIELLDSLENMINNAKKSIISNKVSLERDDLLGFITELRDRLPQEVERAYSILRNRDSILQKAHQEADELTEEAKDAKASIIAVAHEEADNMLKEARGEAERIVYEANEQRKELIDNNQITLLATEQAKGMVEDAKQQARMLRANAIEYIDDKMSELETFLCNNLQEVRDNRATLQ